MSIWLWQSGTRAPFVSYTTVPETQTTASSSAAFSRSLRTMGQSSPLDRLRASDNGISSRDHDAIQWSEGILSLPLIPKDCESAQSLARAACASVSEPHGPAQISSRPSTTLYCRRSSIARVARLLAALRAAHRAHSLNTRLSVGLGHDGRPINTFPGSWASPWPRSVAHREHEGSQGRQ